MNREREEEKEAGGPLSRCPAHCPPGRARRAAGDAPARALCPRTARAGKRLPEGPGGSPEGSQPRRERLSFPPLCARSSLPPGRDKTTPGPGEGGRESGGWPRCPHAQGTARGRGEELSVPPAGGSRCPMAHPASRRSWSSRSRSRGCRGGRSPSRPGALCPVALCPLCSWQPPQAPAWPPSPSAHPWCLHRALEEVLFTYIPCETPTACGQGRAEAARWK